MRVLRINSIITVLSRNLSLLLILLVVATIFRNGFSLYGLRWKQFEAGRSGDFLCEYRDCGQLYIAHTVEEFGYRFGAAYYFIAYAIFLIISILIVVRQLSFLNYKTKIKVLVLFSYLPASTIILQRFGTFDAIALMMSLIGVLSRTKFGALLAAIISLGTNPEATIVSGAGLLLLIFFARFGSEPLLKFTKNSLSFGFFQVALSTPIILLSFFDNTGGSVVEAIFFVDSTDALAQLIASGPLLIFSWFGSLWFVIFLISRSFRSEIRFRIYLTIILIGATTLVASDGTRNSALGLTSITVALLLSNQGIKVVSNLSKNQLLALFAIPAINIANFNIVLPFYQFLYLFDIARPILVAN